MQAKLYVGNLSYQCTEDELKSLFSQAGEVKSVAIITERDPGRSKGFGFVEMPSDEDANKAIASLNETDLDGRTIVVKPANPKAPGSDQAQ